MSQILICSVCGVNHVEEINKEEEICQECLDIQDNSGSPRELNFEDRELRKDDRMLPVPEDNWEEDDD